MFIATVRIVAGGQETIKMKITMQYDRTEVDDKNLFSPPS
jgi:hypothetical protein